MSQYAQFQPAPPARLGEQPGYAAARYGQPGFQPQKTNTMAILGLVFAFVFTPLGIVFSAIGLKQIKERREGGRGLALTGLILSIVFLVIGILIAVLALTVFKAAVDKAQSGSSAAVADGASTDPADDPTGVVAACGVIVPAVVNLESDLSTVETPEDYATVMGDLRTTMEAAPLRRPTRLHRPRAEAVERLPAGDRRRQRRRGPVVPRGRSQRRRHADRRRLRSGGLRPVAGRATQNPRSARPGPAWGSVVVGDTGFEPVTSSV